MLLTPKVSVIIPVYNVEKYLRECLDSVAGQTLRDIEIICVDDGSTDGSLDILREYEAKDSRVKVLTQTNQYAGVARNNGLRYAVGSYVFFMDGDDYCSLQLLERALVEAEKTDADMVVFDHNRYDEGTGRVEEKRDVAMEQLPGGCKVFNYRTNPKRIMSIVNPVPWNKLLRREFLLKWNLTFEPLSSTNDITFSALCAACADRIAYLNETLITYRVNVKDSITSTKTKNLSNVIRALCQTYYRARRFPHYAEIEPSVQVFVARNLMFALKNYAKEEETPRYTDFLNEIGKIFFGLPLFYSLDEVKVGDKTLCQSIRELKKRAEEAFDTTYFPRVIVSLTSYPKRIGMVNQVVETLLHQTMKPDMIVLWLAGSQFPNREQELPEQLTSLLSNCFQIRWTEDIRSYKKLIPALEVFQDDIIITVDDDLLVMPEIVERLVRGYRKHPGCIQCHRVTTVDYQSMDEITVTPDALQVYPAPTYLHKLSGGAGCLYPPHSLHPDVLRKELFMQLAPTSDDIWFWMMGALNGYKVNVVEGNLPRLHYIPGTQEDALWKQNDQGEKLFFVHLRNILRYYPILQDVLSYEYLMRHQPEGAAQGAGLEEMRQLQLQLSMQRRRADFNAAEIRAIHNSATYKIGRFITWLPRKARGGIRCYQEHGWQYTWQRVLVHLHIKKEEDEVVRLVQPLPRRTESTHSPTLKASEVKRKAPIQYDYEYYKNLDPSKYEEELKRWFKRHTKKELNLENPETFNEKIQWMKLYDSTPLKTRLADKYLVREWVAEKIGEEYLVPLLGVWDSFDEIDFDQLPDQFVLKANHGCGWNIIVKNKAEFDVEDAREKFYHWMKMNFAFRAGLELQYLNIPPKIIAEEYLENDNSDLYDYKVFCFNGKAESIMFLSERNKGLKMAFYDLSWNKLPISYSFPRNEEDVPAPQNLKQLIELSEKLAVGFPHVRVDFYVLNDGSLKFGEMTFSSASGACRWNPPEQDRIYGDLIHLPPKSPLPEINRSANAAISSIDTNSATGNMDIT